MVEKTERREDGKTESPKDGKTASPKDGKSGRPKAGSRETGKKIRHPDKGGIPSIGDGKSESQEVGGPLSVVRRPYSCLRMTELINSSTNQIPHILHVIFVCLTFCRQSETNRYCALLLA